MSAPLVIILSFCCSITPIVFNFENQKRNQFKTIMALVQSTVVSFSLVRVNSINFPGLNLMLMLCPTNISSNFKISFSYSSSFFDRASRRTSDWDWIEYYTLKYHELTDGLVGRRNNDECEYCSLNHSITPCSLFSD